VTVVALREEVVLLGEIKKTFNAYNSRKFTSPRVVSKLLHRLRTIRGGNDDKTRIRERQ